MSQEESFHDVVSRNVHGFSEVAARMIGSMFGARCLVGPPEVLEGGLSAEKKFFASILFTGTIYGEYVLAMDEKTAASLIGQSLEGKQGAELDKARKEISDTFCELLNMVVGESIVSLNNTFKKLTVTPPRIYFGSLSYPRIKTGKAMLASDRGSIECYLYVDRMKLDIASSYKDAMSSLVTAHQELQAAMQRLQTQQAVLVQSEKMAALGTMAAGVAHEINSPLATVSVMGDRIKEMVGEEEIDKGELVEMLNIIDVTVTRIARITNSLRVFANGARHEKPTMVKIGQVIDGTLVICEQSLKERGVQLRYDTPSDNIWLECRASEISQVLLSLINNACDAIEELPEKWIQVSVTESPDSITVQVTDSGTGIPEQIRDKIFDPFFTTKDVGKGAGLGLSIVKGIVTKHLGGISIDQACANTRFIIHLPKHLKQKAG